MKKKRRILFYGGAILILAIVGFGIYIAIVASADLRQLDQKKETAIANNIKNSIPLKAEVIQDMCQKLKLPENDKRCQPGMIVHDVDFYEDIRRYFQALPKEKTTQAEVDRILGPYLVECSPFPENANAYFSCTYDLSDNNLYPIVVEYDIERKIKILVTTPGSS